MGEMGGGALQSRDLCGTIRCKSQLILLKSGWKSVEAEERIEWEYQEYLF